MSFADAVINQDARTTNGMKARASTANPVVDLFYKIGASRGKDITADFVAAFTADQELALRIALWARDVRGGAGERQLFRDILRYLEVNDIDAAKALAEKVPEIGRWDDLLAFQTVEARTYAFDIIRSRLIAGNQLCAKWMPRKGKDANDLRKHLLLSPKEYRKLLVGLTNVVENHMCAKEWEKINYSHVPSVAASRYKKAFRKHDQARYDLWAQKLATGEDGAKVNAGAVYPYQVIQQINSYAYGPYGHSTVSKAELDVITAQWQALPDYMNGRKVLAMVDVSGSMGCPAGKSLKSGVTCHQVALSLGLYVADKNKGEFKDTFLTFSGNPKLLHLKGNIVQKLQQMNKSEWDMNTNLHAAVSRILDVAKKGNVAQEDMPEILLILSDMQFDACARFDDSAMEMIKRKYAEAGYTMPQIVFWNLNANDNVPVKSTDSGVALVSGFSPSILKAVLSADLEEFTPYGIMMKAIMHDRYNLV